MRLSDKNLGCINPSLNQSLHYPTMTSAGAPGLIVLGVYVPSICFFTRETEDVDTAIIAKNIVRLAQAGVTGVATQGSNGEAVHLTKSERRLVRQQHSVPLITTGSATCLS